MQTWERAEIERSRIEAALTDDAGQPVPSHALTRYDAPPADTAFPLEYAFHLLGDVTGLRLVDLGCGSGLNTVRLAHRGAAVYGLDISSELIALATQRLAVNGRAGSARFVIASAHDLPFADASIDIVFGIAILHHLDLQLVSREVHRVLRPGGRAIFQEPVRNSKLFRVLRALIPYQARDISPFERPLTDSDLVLFARPFSRMQTRAFMLPHVQIGSLIPVVRDQVASLYASDGALLRAIPALQHFAAVRVVELTK
jgi:SAM-dependent methyltransferase